MDQGNLMDREWSIDQGNLMSHETWLRLTAFSEDIRIEHTHDWSGKPDERNSSNAKIRTLLEEQRQTIIEEYREKVGHHELHPSSSRRRASTPTRTIMATEIGISCVIDDQNTVLELSGIVQELQNEVNCMNDSKDFQDAESVRSGNSQGRQVFGTHMVHQETFL